MELTALAKLLKYPAPAYPSTHIEKGTAPTSLSARMTKQFPFATPTSFPHASALSLSISFFLPPLLGKLTATALRGEPAMTTSEIPLLTLGGHHNLIDVEVDGIPVIALIDTGAHILIINSNFHTHPKKVLTLTLRTVVHVADGGQDMVECCCLFGCPIFVLENTTMTNQQA